ncbi:hypothetical protein DPMN_114897 [Dreissena polymorpha]|uniref:Uncharacterized protein n=1 Tax=Dreissena polymorpha TaxID=45954 RepID=A0A9D4KKZ9_DREPO|nr:hypothetical protein DPMN_114897 [Dreissena polymorpha]
MLQIHFIDIWRERQLKTIEPTTFLPLFSSWAAAVRSHPRQRRQRLKWDHDIPTAGTGVPLPNGVHTDRCILAVSDQYVSCIF